MTKSGARALWVLMLLLATANVAWAGADASLTREFERLIDIQRRVESLPAYQELEQLKQRILFLRLRLDYLSRQPRVSVLDRQKIQVEISSLQRELQDLQKVVVRFREAIGLGQEERFFPGTRHRVAVFTFDDPDATGLGDPISFLLSKKLLFSTRVASFAVVNYLQGADRNSASNLAYFDLVDAVIKDQGFSLAIWGRLSRTEQGVRVDSFLQVPADADKAPYVRTVRLPESMGGGTLNTRLKPDRILLQGMDLDLNGTRSLERAAEQLAMLRARPASGAPITGRLGGYGNDVGVGGSRDEVPSSYVITDSQRDWIQLRLSNGRSGWTSVDHFCNGACGALLDVATFANDVVALTSDLAARPVSTSLTREAAAMSQQLTALVSLSNNPTKTLEIANRWALDGLSIPGGASFTNFLAVARVKAELIRANARQPKFDRIRLDRRLMGQIAEQLAGASIADPGDIDVVENLAVLFAYIGDDRRQRLASEIAANLKDRSRR